MAKEQNKQRPQNLPESQARRKTMKKLAIGAGALAGYSMLPEKWTRPVIEGIVLPAHAQTSANLVLCPELTLTLLSGTQTSATVTVQVKGCVTPPTGGANVQLVVLGSQDIIIGTSTAERGGQQEDNLLTQALTAAGDLLVSKAMAAECSEIVGSAVTDAQGNFSADFEIPCGPGIRSVLAIATLEVGNKTPRLCRSYPRATRRDNRTTARTTARATTGTTSLALWLDQ